MNIFLLESGSIDDVWKAAYDERYKYHSKYNEFD
jgi:hypothetical protein